MKKLFNAAFIYMLVGVGIAGLGHILVTAGMIVFFVALRRVVVQDAAEQGPARGADTLAR